MGESIKTENFSYSKMSTYSQCGFKYKLVYVDSHFLWSNSIATEFGTLIHATEESIAKAIQANKPIDYILLKNNIIIKMAELEYKYKDTFYDLDKSDRTYKEKMYYYLEYGIYRLEKFMQQHPSYEIVGIEQSFKVPYSEQYILKGFIDRVFHDKDTDKYIIQDIKTWAVPAERSELTTPLQFVYYTLAAKELYKCTEDQISCQYDLPLCDLTQDAGTTGYMTRGLKKMNEHFNNIEAKNFKPKPSPLCHWCEFCPTNPNQPAGGKRLCPYYMKWTKTHKTFDVARTWEGPDKHQKILEEYLNDTKGGDNLW